MPHCRAHGSGSCKDLLEVRGEHAHLASSGTPVAGPPRAAAIWRLKVFCREGQEGIAWFLSVFSMG
jgi:hypothetical protein